MKRYLNQIRKFVSKNVSIPVMVALLFVGGMAVAKAKFSHRLTTPNYYNTGTAAAPVWHDLTRSLGTVAQPGTYRCISSSNICTAYFTDEPEDGQTTTDSSSGSYTENN